MIDTLLAKGFTIFAQFMVWAQPKWDKYKVPICIILGLAIGLVIGWGIMPLKWTDASAGHLNEYYRAYYLAAVAEEYVQTGDMTKAATRLGLNLEVSNSQKRNIPWLNKPESLDAHIKDAYENAAKYGFGDNTNKIQTLQYLENELPRIREAVAASQQDKAPTLLANLFKLVGVLLLLGLAVGIIWFLLLRNRKAAEPEAAETYEAVDVGVDEATGMMPDGTAPPVKSFTTTYVLGDDYFDPSFSIEIGADFLGECGIGISETIGAGDPKKVTAFEGWLFDKSDIRTVTTVLASDYATGEADLRAKLEPKGDIETIAAGKEITLETTALRVQVRVKELEYAQGNLPTNSFIQRAVFELRAWVKATDDNPPEPVA